jgi:hypothetical protein
MNKTAVEWLVDKIENDSDIIFYDRNLHPFEQYVEIAKAIEKDQLGALYLTLLLNTPDIAQFDFEEWYKQNTTHE